MKEEIINKVANSSLITIDMEDLYPSGDRITLDITPWLFKGLVLREKNFRELAKNHDWEQYKDCYVAIICSSEAIIPTWAYMLISIYLSPLVKKSVVGTLNDLEELIFSEVIFSMSIKEYQDKPVIIKGCSHLNIPENAYLLLTQKLKPVVKSLMFGEACSSVPLYKKK